MPHGKRFPGSSPGNPLNMPASRPLLNVVWFKRDLRTQDHAPLHAAAANGLPTLLLYCLEPSLLALPEYDDRHWRFIREALDDLQRALTPFGAQLHIWQSEAPEALRIIDAHFQIKNLFSHQETGLLRTFQRDLAVAALCREKGIEWTEFEQDGVRRARKHRKGWQKAVEAQLETPCVDTELRRIRFVQLETAHSAPHFNQLGAAPEGMQPGGATAGRRYLDSFVRERARQYSKHISKPADSRRSCSRLSPYLAWGCLSAREIWQAAESAKSLPGMRSPLANFQSRIWWRSHFMQKMESDYEMEWLDINRAFQYLPRGQDERLFNAWASGNTGYPMVDAAMRSLHATGYVNFRMRAMLVTFWSFTLWQDWRVGARHLARLFLDFEPGIHYPQWQMQSGTTGYGTLRIYNPTVQCERHDPAGAFVLRWVPELKNVPPPLLFEPWKMTPLDQNWYDCRIGESYPAPVVEFDKASRIAKDRYWIFRQSPEVQDALPGIWRRLCVGKAGEEGGSEKIS